MLRKYTSTESVRNSSKEKENKRRSTSCSPYSKNFKSNLTHDQRELLSHRQHVKKLLRCELEDRYLDLLDENFAIKRENIANHDNIRKLVTKILRLSGDSKIRLNSASSKQNISCEEDLQIRIIDLESHNAQLRDKLSFFIKNHQLTKRCSSAVTLPGSHSNLLQKSKILQSKDNIQYSGESIASSQQDLLNDQQQHQLKKKLTNGSKNENTILEHSEPTSLNDANPCNHDENEIRELKEIVEKLQWELSQEKSQNEQIVNNKQIMEEKLSKELKTQQGVDSMELKKTRKELVQCEKEILRLNAECKKLRKNHEISVEAEQNRIFELTTVLEKEITKNKQLMRQTEFLEAQVDSIDILKQETTVIQAENELLKHHRGNISSLATELATRNEKINRLLRSNEDLHKSLIETKANLSAYEECQQEMIRKIQDLQDRNDELIVQIQGFKAEIRCLYERISMLEMENRELKYEKM